MRQIRAEVVDPPIVVNKNEEKGVFGLTWLFAFISLYLLRLPSILSPQPRAKRR